MKPFDTFILRTPIFPYVTTDVKSETTQRKLILNSLEIFVPDLASALNRDSGSNDRAEQAVLKYLLRSKYDCTPFGIFAGIAIGTVGQTTSLKLSELNDLKPVSRLDHGFLYGIIECLKERVKFKVKYKSNDSIYRISESFRFIDRKNENVENGVMWNHSISSADFNDYLDAVMNFGKEWKDISEITGKLVEMGIDEENATEYIAELIDENLLFSEIELNTTGQDNLTRILNTLKDRNLQDELLFLKGIQKELSEITSVHNLVETRNRIIDISKNFLSKEIKVKDFLQIDIVKPTVSCEIGAEVISSVQSTTNILAKLFQEPRPKKLEDFKKKFSTRYGDSTQSLLDVLDPDFGIGYPVGISAFDSDILRATLKNPDSNTTSSYTVKKNPLHKFLIDRYFQASTNSNVMRLSSKDLSPFLTGEANLPPTLFAMFSLTGNAQSAKPFLSLACGPSAISLIGRFSHCSDEIGSLISKVASMERKMVSSCIIAEIVHLAHPRTGNVTFRNKIHDYEIPILCEPSVDRDHTIELSDLQICLREGRLLLMSKRLMKEVIPTGCTAHNFAIDTIPVYHFLRDMQFENSFRSIEWRWDFMGETVYYPRVEIDGVIVDKESWFLPKMSSPVDNLYDFKEYLQQYKIKSSVVLHSQQSQLPLNLENEAHLRILVKELQVREIKLTENLYDDSQFLVTDGKGGFTNEIILPFYNENFRKIDYSHDVIRSLEERREQLSVMSNCLYLKIYSNISSSFDILNKMANVCDKIKELDNKFYWFFIRYYDHDDHIRFRIFCDRSIHSQALQYTYDALNDLIESRKVFSIQIDEYDREIFRYGAKNILNSEQIFFNDSVSVVEILRKMKDDVTPKTDLWIMGLIGIDFMLDDFQFDLEERLSIMNRMGWSFKQEFRYTDTDSLKLLSNEYRKNRGKISTIIERNDTAYDWIFEIFKIRSNANAPLIREIERLIGNGQLRVSKEELFISYTHMFINRLFSSNQRRYELIIYDMLSMYYKSLNHKVKA